MLFGLALDRDLFFDTLFSVSVGIYVGFWLWAIIHAASTPKSSVKQRLFWAGSMFVNPSTAVWYWYIWKRWAFWILFTPIFGAFVSLPFVVRSLLTHAQATHLTDALFALGSQQVVLILATLFIFPLLLRLAALLHLGRNADLSAMDRNDWVVSLALPVFGFGAGMAYCARHRRIWALVSLVWWVALAFTIRYIAPNIWHALIPAGAVRRQEILLNLAPLRHR